MFDEHLKKHIVPGVTLASLSVLLALIELIPALRIVVVPSVYLSFHSFFEATACLISGMIFGVGWYSYDRERPSGITILACAFFAVGLLDFGHMLSFQGMPDFITPSSPSKALSFWLSARIMLAMGLLALVTLPWKPFISLRARWFLLGGCMAAIVATYWVILFVLPNLPERFVAGNESTFTKVGTEYFVIALHLLVLVMIFRNRRRTGAFDVSKLAAGVVVLVLSEWCFTHDATVTDTWLVVGHLYKIIGYAFIYHAIFVSGIRDPYNRLNLSEARAQREKASTQATLNALADAVIKIDRQGNIDYLNPAASHMLGVQDRDALGRSFAEVVNIVNEQSDRPYLYPALESLSGLPSSTSSNQLLLVRRDGREIPIEDTASPFLDADGQVAGAVITLRDVEERRQALKLLWQSEHMFHDLLEFAPDAIVISDAGGHISVVNSQAEKLFGYDRTEMIGQSIEILIPPRLRGDHDRYRSGYHGQPHVRPMGIGKDIFCLRKDGVEFPSDISLGPLETTKGKVVMAVVRDMTARRRQEAEMRETARYARSLIEASLDPLVTIDADGRITDVNHATEKVTGLMRDKLIGSDFAVYFTEPDVAQQGYLTAFSEGVVHDWPLTIRHADDTLTDVLYNATVYRDEAGQVQGVFAAARDITERKDFEDQLRHRATHDTLTGLPNRALLQDRLQQGIAQARRVDGMVAVMFIDLDNFKAVNDTLGHAIGDGLLMSVANRIRNELRGSDTVARFGGDEFVLLMNDMTMHDLDGVARKVLEVIARPCEVAGHQIHTQASMGIALFPLDGQDDETLIRNADTAMYYAKSRGRNSYRYYSHEMNRELCERQELADGLRKALEREEFELYYQPKADLRTGALSGLEALIRWRHPEHGMVSPARFIPVAEECGLIVEIGVWVIEKACRQIRLWLDAGLDPVRVAVNLSASQCHTDDVVTRIRRALEVNKLSGNSLEVEITESMVMHDTEASMYVFHALHALNLHVAIDDFGTGYSSLSYLKRFPISCLKIDKSFVDGIETDANDIEIVRAIVAMAHSLGLKVVAEGVETSAQLAFLRQSDCDEMQGYLFSKPLPVAEATTFLTSRGRLDFAAKNTTATTIGT